VKTLVSSKKWYQKPWLITTSIIGGLVVLSFFIQDQTPTPTITAQESQQELSVDEPAGAEVAEAPETAPTDYLAEGKAEGYSTAVAAQTATGNDWNDVGLGWDAAMRSLGKVPADSPDYAEAQSKLAEYTANREVASARYNAHLAELNQAKIEADRAQAQAKAGALDSYRAEIRRIDPSGQFIVRVEPDPFMKDCDSCIDIVVASGFLSQNKANRLEAAKQLWTSWVLHSGVTSADKARIRLVTQSGTKVGGSGSMGGGMISVDD
jgi:hypothetical protein